MVTYEELQEIRQVAFGQIQLRLSDISHDKFIQDEIKHDEHHILVCGGTGCHAGKAEDLELELERLIAEYDLEDKIKVVFTGCFGLCESGPNIVVYPEGAFYSHLEVDDMKQIMEEHIVGGKICRDLLYEESLVGDDIKPMGEVDFYKHQTRIALRNCGVIAPEDINEYIAMGGYEQLGRVLTENVDRGEILQEVIDANVRGRGGAGFPAGVKWKTAYEYDAPQKYVICNADEGDPGAFMDRSILEGDPHSVLEAMALCGYVIGADKGYIYVRAEYPIAVDRLNVAMEQAREKGLLGDNIFGTDFNFDIELRLGAGAFVCGEGTALMESMEGKRGIPRFKAERTAHSGLWDEPTIINNVETYANIPIILEKGADWFKSYGTEDSPGTKVFALGGKINNTGLVEIPMGVTLNEVVYDIGGGAPNGKEIKAVQTGGPSGGCIPPQYFDTPVDFKSLEDIGSIMGSGGMVVMDEDDCIVDIAKFFMEFTVDESCGKCTPCRIGNKRVLEILDRITSGKSNMAEYEKLQELCQIISDTSLCGLGKTATTPVLSSIEYFGDEYLEHVQNHHCPAGVCTDLLEYVIHDNCIGCGLCVSKCPVDAISGDRREIHSIDVDECIKCDACRSACPIDAIVME